MLNLTAIGVLSSDPELRSTDYGAVCNFKIACRSGADLGTGEVTQTWVKATIWGDAAQQAAATLAKGCPICLQGKAKVREWIGNDGTSGTNLEVSVSVWTVLASYPAPGMHGLTMVTVGRVASTPESEHYGKTLVTRVAVLAKTGTVNNPQETSLDALLLNVPEDEAQKSLVPGGGIYLAGQGRMTGGRLEVIPLAWEALPTPVDASQNIAAPAAQQPSRTTQAAYQVPAGAPF